MTALVPLTPDTPGVAAPMPSYGGYPALKPSVYGLLVALYIFIGGAAGSVQIVATMIDAAGPAGTESVVLAGRLFALGGAIAGGILLIVELHTPQRFYNMLRIFRPTSPISIGTYVLTGFGFFSLLALAGHALDWHWLAFTGGVLASLLGVLMACYPAALLSATSTPLWSAAPRLLAVRFGAASMASGSAVLCIAALWLLPSLRVAALAAATAAVSLLVELTATLLARRVYAQGGLDGALRGRYGLAHLGAELLSLTAVVLYVLVGIFDAAAIPLMVAASICVLTGGLAMRDSVLRAGNESARRPEDYFRLACDSQVTERGGAA